MKRSATSRWHLTLSAVALAATLAGGGGTWTWAQTAAPPATTVAPANRAAALEAFKKALDLYQNDKIAEATAENDKALQLDPTLTDAQLLKRILASKATTATGPGDTTTKTGTAEKVRLLKPADITLIRLAELSSADEKQIKGRINRKTLDAFWNEVVRKSENANITAGAQAAWVQPTNFWQQVQAFKDHGNREYMEKIEFHNDPLVLLNFKQKVLRYTLDNCATATCHAGDKAGSFRLIRPNANDQAAIYTDFYILSMYQSAAGKIIDRDNPEKSLLLQYCLPKNVAAAVHPKVDVQHRFADVTAPEFQAIVEWIKSLAFPRPNYGIVYEMPAPAPAPVAPPATTTAPAPAKSPAK